MKNTIALFFLLITGTIFAQKTERDVVYLKNGSIVKGKITEMNPSENLKIQTADGSLFVYAMSDIQKMEKEEFVGREVNQETSAVVSQKSLENVFINYINKNRPEIKFIGVSKKNGIKRNIAGIQLYDLEYELILETKQEMYVNDSQFGSAFLNKFIKDFSYTLQDASGYEAAFSASKKKLSKGQRIVFEGSLGYELTDNGWRSTQFVNKNFKMVSPNYLSPEMAKQQAEEKAKLAEELKKKLDWNRPDIEPVEFVSHYFFVENVPLFKYSNNKYSIKPSANFKGRNDVLSSIQKTFYTSINSTNRFVESEEDSFTSSQNSGSVEFIISEVNFVFNTTGYQCNIAVYVTASGTFQDPETFPFDTKASIVSKSNNYKKNFSKSQALSSALDDLFGDIRGHIFKYEPTALELIRVETNKRGKVDKVVFKKPERFIDTKKTKIVVLAPTDLIIKNNKFSLLGKVGDCIFKGEIVGDEIICNVSGGKNKKAFEKVIGTDEAFIGITSY